MDEVVDGVSAVAGAGAVSAGAAVDEFVGKAVHSPIYSANCLSTLLQRYYRLH